jgi:predicted site-specific integrase-resolvase
VSRIVYKGQEYFRTQDVCEMAGISKSTLLRWLRSGVVKRTCLRDRRGWRLYSKEDIDRIASVANQVSPEADRNGDDEA